MTVSSHNASKKVIGTAMPLFSLRSRNSRPESKHGTVVDAFRFLDWLALTEQQAWQVLPLSESHLEPNSKDIRVPSPYKGYGIGLDRRFLDGKWAELEPNPGQLADFRQKESAWIEDYVAFCVMRDAFGTDDWTQWPERELREHEAAAIEAWAAEHTEETRKELVTQWRLKQAFRDLRNRANELGVAKIGDLPFYLPLQSPLVWAHQHCFQIENGKLNRVSGIPVGPNSHFGRQVWGHPLYNWSSQKSIDDIVRLWQIRLGFYADFYNTMRLDHSKGFYRYGAISLKPGVKDTIEDAPGDTVLEKVIVSSRQAGLEIFAEDSGFQVRALIATLQRLKVPGLRILRFAYNEKKKKLDAKYSDLDNYPADSFAYTSTHDTVTLIEYVRLLNPAEQRHLCEHIGITHSDDEKMLASRLRQALLQCPAANCIVALQDWMLWPDRINVPGTEKPVGDENWRWRMPIDIEDLPKRVYGHGPDSFAG